MLDLDAVLGVPQHLRMANGPEMIARALATTAARPTPGRHIKGPVSRTWTRPRSKLEAFADRWADEYPAMVAVWRREWDESTPFWRFPVEVSKII